VIVAVCFALTLTAVASGSVLAKSTTAPSEVLTGTVVHTDLHIEQPVTY
jgi:hypothetical protein